jgi:multiple sugar transport system ATP-binding protein
MAAIQFNHVSKEYDAGTLAVDDLNLEVAEGEFVVLVGPSGCGKTTALRMVAGLEEVTAGEIRIGDRVVNDLAPRERDLAMVFQNYALYPHKTVYENLVFGLRMRKVAKVERRRRVEEIARILGLEEMLERRPAQLSGGQRQRVAMGRAIVREPQAFLMDEPLSNLDAKLRVQMRAEIARIQQTLRVTTLYVTHDQVEAMTMGHRVAVMRSGVLQQVDTPQRLYDFPGNLFVASFVGSPAMNLLEVGLERDGGTLVCRSGDVEIELPSDIFARRPQLERYVGRRLALGIRPEALSESSADPDAPRLRGRALLVEALGAESLAHVEVSATPLDRPELVDVSASQAHLLPVGDRTATLLARLEHDTGVKPGHVVDLAVDVRRLHFFDLESGGAVPVAAVPAAAVV